MKAHPLSGVSLQNQIGEFSPKHLLERMLLRCDDVDGKHAAEQGRRRLHRDETSAHDSNASAGDHLGENASAVLKGPQHHHMRQVSSRNIQSSWSGARGEEKLLIGSLVPVRQTQAFVSGLDLLDALVALEVHAKVSQGMPGDWQSVVPEGALEIVLREKRPVIGLFALLREYRYPATPAELANCVRCREPGRATAHDRHRPKRGLALYDTSRCLRAGGLHEEAVIIKRNRVLEQSVESGSGCRFVGRKIEASMMPRTPDGRADDNTLVQRSAEVRACCAVSLEAISVSPDEDAIFADNAGKDFAVGHLLDFAPLG